MKYLAILKDSLREALDSKVLYVTLFLSGLLVLIAASLSFRQISAQEQVEGMGKLMTWISHLQNLDVDYNAVDFKQVGDSVDPWLGDYRFEWVVKLPKDKPPGKDPMPADMKQKHFEQVTSPNFTRMMVEQSGPRFDKIELGPRREVPLAADADFAKEYHFPVTTHGTKIKDRRGWVYEPALFFGGWRLSIFHFPLGSIMEFITDDVIGTFGAGIMMLLSVIITAFFIPNMLRKGTIDLLLAKPIHRVTLLVYKFIGGLSFMFLNTVVIMVGIWLVLGLRTNLWVNGLLACVFIFTFQFAIFYAVSTLMAVWTRSPIVAILVSVVAWALFWGIGVGYRWIDSNRARSKLEQSAAADAPDEQMRRQSVDVPTWLTATADVLHFITPHYKDLDLLTTRLIRRDLSDPGSQQREEIEKSVSSINWTESITMTLVFMGLVLGIACWWFARKDY